MQLETSNKTLEEVILFVEEFMIKERIEEKKLTMNGVAASLGISRATLYRRMAKYNSNFDYLIDDNNIMEETLPHGSQTCN